MSRQGSRIQERRINFDPIQGGSPVEQEPRALGVAQLGLTQERQLPELATNKVIEQELNLVTLGEPSPEQQAVINAVRQVATSLGMPVLK